MRAWMNKKPAMKKKPKPTPMPNRIDDVAPHPAWRAARPAQPNPPKNAVRLRIDRNPPPSDASTSMSESKSMSNPKIIIRIWMARNPDATRAITRKNKLIERCRSLLEMSR